MKKLIIVLSLSLALPALAQTPAEPSWKAKLRGVITQVAGAEWGDKLLGPAPKPPGPELLMPEIPQDLKKTTDVGSYSKQKKEPTEFDRLPAERKRQFDYKFLEELFQVTRKSPPRDEDLVNWLNTLEQGGSREGIYQALVLDEIYNGLESIEESPSTKLVELCLNFSQKFLAQTFKPESISQLNLYSLKRIFTEKGLDLLEYYEIHDLDSLYRWYALFSAYLAQTYPTYLHGEVRQNQDEQFHYQWAKSMPIQHIKSEFIIKLHSVMNQLQLISQ